MTTSAAEKYAQIASLVGGVQSHRNAEKREVWRQIVDIVNDEVDAPEVSEANSDGGGDADSKWLDLKSLTVKQLQALADEEGIDLGKAKAKGEILAIVEAAAPKVEELPDTTGWHAVATAPDGTVVYDGLAPIPDEFVTITPEMLEAGQAFSIEMTPPEAV